MIIKINVNDNDFAEKIEDILETKINGLIFITDEYFNKQLADDILINNPQNILEKVPKYITSPFVSKDFKDGKRRTTKKYHCKQFNYTTAKKCQDDGKELAGIYV